MSDARVGRGDQVVVFGAGGHARSVTDVVSRLGAVVIACVIDDDEGIALARDGATGALVAIGDPDVRLAVAERVEAAQLSLLTLVAGSATVAEDVAIGAGSVVLEHAHVGPGSRLGKACIVNSHASVDHDCQLGDSVHIAPGAVLAGGVRCGARAFVGVGASVIPGVTVGAGSTVGAGATVVSDVACGIVVVGVPARVTQSGRRT